MIATLPSAESRIKRFVIKNPRKPTAAQRIKSIKDRNKETIRETEAEIFHIMQMVIDRDIQPADADHKVWMLREDIACIKETERLTILRIKEE